MKKLLACTLILSLALMLVASMAVQAFAVTPSFTPPELPKIPEIKFDFKFLSGFWDKFWKEHMPPDIEFPAPTEPEATEPEVTEPEIVELGVTSITEARYYHGSYSRLQIQWEAVDGAKSYEVEVTKADGATDVYTTDSATLYLTNVECPRVYIEESSTWAAASVKVRAVSGDAVGEWSETKKIGCDMIHMV